MASNDPHRLNTLAAMKTRIADEIGRDDLSSQIALAISDAISCYNNERFYFNETRNLIFQGVQGQAFYTTDDLPDLPNILDIDYVYCYQNNYPYLVSPMPPEQLEMLTVGGITLGLPYLYCFYAQQFRCYPMPIDNSYTFRIAAAICAAPPADDNETGNPWMTDAERMIRSRAKYELALHVLYDDDLAARMGGTSQDADGNPTGGAAGDAYWQLKQKTNRLIKIGDGWVKPMDF